MTIENLELTIRLSNGTRLPLDIGAVTPTDCTVRQVKEKLVNECPVERQRLIYKGRILEDGRTLQDYGIAPKSTLFLVKGSAAPASAPPAAPAPTSTTPNPASASAFSNASPSAPSRAPPASNPSTNPWGNPLAGTGSNSNPMSMMGAGGMNPMMANPEQMQQMMNSPFMSSLLDNPQMLQNIMEMQMQTNPQMRQMMDSNPMLREMLNDPSVLRQAVDMMRNPAAFQQAMRNQDLAMSNIENMPGGFAALSNMYRDIQQPLEESMVGSQESSSSNSNSAPNSTNSNAGAAGSAMPNPWGSPTTTNNNTSQSSSNSGFSNNNNDNNNPFAAMMGGGGNLAAANNPWASGGGAGMPPQPSQDQLNAAINMMENPMIRQMMDQAINENPDLFRNMMAAQNPMLGQMFQNNPEAANQMIRTMMDPNIMRSMAQLQQAMGGSANPNNVGTHPSGSNAASHTPVTPVPGMDFTSLFQSMQNTHIGAQPSAAPQNPADRFRNQLRSLYEMGFDDEQQCMAALQSAHGNLNRAVDMLLAGEVPASAPQPAAPSASPSPPSDAPSSENNSEPEAPAPAPKDAEDKKND